MAMAEQRAMSVTLMMRDQERSDSRMRLHYLNPQFALVPDFGAPVYLNYVHGTLVTVVQALTDSPISGVSAVVRAVQNPRPTVGAGEAEKKGVFLFGDANGGKLFRMKIPGIKEACLTANKRDIDLSNSLIAAFLTAMTTGDVRCVTENGINLTGVGIGDAYKQHASSHKGKRRRTG